MSEITDYLLNSSSVPPACPLDSLDSMCSCKRAHAEKEIAQRANANAREDKEDLRMYHALLSSPFASFVPSVLLVFKNMKRRVEPLRREGRRRTFDEQQSSRLDQLPKKARSLL